MATIPRENLLFINADEGEESKPPAASITTDNMLLVKRQLPNQSELKYLITSFLATQRPRPSVARADRRTGTAIASREEFHHTFNISSSFFYYFFFLFLLTPGKRLMDFAPTKQTHSNCFPECILFNNSPFDRREKNVIFIQTNVPLYSIRALGVMPARYSLGESAVDTLVSERGDGTCREGRRACRRTGSFINSAWPRASLASPALVGQWRIVMIQCCL